MIKRETTDTIPLFRVVQQSNTIYLTGYKSKLLFITADAKYVYIRFLACTLQPHHANLSLVTIYSKIGVSLVKTVCKPNKRS